MHACIIVSAALAAHPVFLGAVRACARSLVSTAVVDSWVVGRGVLHAVHARSTVTVNLERRARDAAPVLTSTGSVCVRCRSAWRGRGFCWSSTPVRSNLHTRIAMIFQTAGTTTPN
jgi:hypothetical protein